MIRIVVGSASVLKIEAVQAAIDLLGLEAEIVGVAAESGVPNQPYGREQTLEGAMNRARAAREAGKGAYAIGIENGLVPSGDAVLDIAFVVVFDPAGRRLVRRSLGVAVPRELVEMSLQSGQRTTAGKLEADRSGCDHADPHRFWSNGQTNRKQILVKALCAVLLPATIHEEGVAP